MRSNLLVHWSGKDLLDLSKIGNTNDLSELDSKEVDQLVQRTWSFLEKGFRMSRCQEQIRRWQARFCPQDASGLRATHSLLYRKSTLENIYSCEEIRISRLCS